MMINNKYQSFLLTKEDVNFLIQVMHNVSYVGAPESKAMADRLTDYFEQKSKFFEL